MIAATPMPDVTATTAAVAHTGSRTRRITRTAAPVATIMASVPRMWPEGYPVPSRLRLAHTTPPTKPPSATITIARMIRSPLASRRPTAIAPAIPSQHATGARTGSTPASGSVWANAPSNSVANTGIVTTKLGSARPSAATYHRRPRTSRSPSATTPPITRPVSANTGTSATAIDAVPSRSDSSVPSSVAPSTCAVTIHA